MNALNCDYVILQILEKPTGFECIFPLFVYLTIRENSYRCCFLETVLVVAIFSPFSIVAIYCFDTDLVSNELADTDLSCSDFTCCDLGCDFLGEILIQLVSINLIKFCFIYLYYIILMRSLFILILFSKIGYSFYYSSFSFPNSEFRC